MTRRKLMNLAVTGALAVGASSGAQAISYTQGAWTLDINGTVNAFYTHTSCDNVANPASWATLSACSSPNDTAAIQNGLLPGWINFVATTRANNLDIKAHFGFSPGTSFDGGTVAANQLMGDVRNVYLSFGDASWGTMKLGRDIGLFQQQAILNDMTLLGVGGNAPAAGAGNTTTGLIGKGYMYTAFQPQITYTTPKFGGFQASVGAFQPLNIDTLTVKETPGFQGLATFDFGAAPGFNGKAWGSFVFQEAEGDFFNATTGVTSRVSQDAEGYELGVKLGVAGFEGVLVAFQGEGIGDALLFLNGTRVDAAGNLQTAETEGFLGQVTFRPIPTTKFGVSYGQTENKDIIPGSAKNTAFAVGVYHDLAPGLTLVGEYIKETTEQDRFTDAESDTFAIGAILFF